MKKQLPVATLCLMAFFASRAQITFESGFFINESDEKIECLIKNPDWENNPREFEYKLTSDAPTHKAGLENVKEFVIHNASKYIRATVKIDRSSSDLTNLSTSRSPEFQDEQLFLKVLIEGKATLFSFKEANLVRFFYTINDQNIDQLVYKQYALNGRIGENNYFRQQLLTSLVCNEITLSDVERLRYHVRDLEALFVKYHHCLATPYAFYNIPTKTKDLFNLSIRPGISSSKVSLANPTVPFMNNQFENPVNPRIGIETELVFPFQKNKWSLIAEPTLRSFKSDNTKDAPQLTGGLLATEVRYQSIELPVGFRHYFFINDASRVFVNAGYCLDFAFNSGFEFEAAGDRPIGSAKIKSLDNFFAGTGFNYQGKYAIEVRYFTGREILGSHRVWRSNFQSWSLIVAYSLF